MKKKLIAQTYHRKINQCKDSLRSTKQVIEKLMRKDERERFDKESLQFFNSLNLREKKFALHNLVIEYIPKVSRNWNKHLRLTRS